MTTTFKEKDAAKALGARWDAGQGKWYVPDGIELTPFSKWLPAGSSPIFASTSTELSSNQTGSTKLSVANKKGVSLSQLLAGVSQAVAQAYKSGVWTMVEVVELRTNGGACFPGGI